MSNTSFGISFCSGERYLKTATTMSKIIGIDIEYARQLVANSVVSIDSAIERVEHAGSLTDNIRTELRNCLGSIAAGECIYYSKQ